MTTPEHQFGVVCRAYYKLIAMGKKPDLRLETIGRNTFGLKPEEIQSIRLKERYFVNGQGVPRDIDHCKGWCIPTPKEEREAA